MRRAAALVTVLILTAACTDSSPAADPSASAVVRTDEGPVRGTVTDTYRLFQGVRYAAAPVGEGRWAAPKRPQAWREARDATKPGAKCPQVGSDVAQVASDQEDCLFLNVTAPRTASKKAPKPVMVWIHGDGASGAGEFFDGRRLATTGDVVVVTINYRLGAFGGFGLPGLADSGTFGLQDQQAALGWVQRNAVAFGGDPRKVTLFGVSWGASSTTAHLTSPGAKGLFQRAILSSGEGMMDMPAASMQPDLEAFPWYAWRSAAEVEGMGSYVAPQLGCPDPATALACLRKLPVQKILALPQVMNMFQLWAYGNRVLPTLPAQVLKDGGFHRLPVLSGMTRDEHRTFVAFTYDAAGTPITPARYQELLTKAFGPRAGAVAAAYPLTRYPSPGLAWADVITDRMWARGTEAQHRALAAHVPTYAYEFADRNAPQYLPFPPTLPSGAYHAADTPYVFPDAEFDQKAKPDQRALSDQLIRYWANFARAGDPNGDGLPAWQPYRTTTPATQSLGTGPGGIKPVDFAAEHSLPFWSRMP